MNRLEVSKMILMFQKKRPRLNSKLSPSKEKVLFLNRNAGVKDLPAQKQASSAPSDKA